VRVAIALALVVVIGCGGSTTSTDDNTADAGPYAPYDAALEAAKAHCELLAKCDATVDEATCTDNEERQLASKSFTCSAKDLAACTASTRNLPCDATLAAYPGGRCAGCFQ
jgi:hypothetical protein